MVLLNGNQEEMAGSRPPPSKKRTGPNARVKPQTGTVWCGRGVVGRVAVV